MKKGRGEENAGDKMKIITSPLFSLLPPFNILQRSFQINIHHQILLNGYQNISSLRSFISSPLTAEFISNFLLKIML